MFENENLLRIWNIPTVVIIVELPTVSFQWNQKKLIQKRLISLFELWTAAMGSVQSTHCIISRFIYIAFTARSWLSLRACHLIWEYILWSHFYFYSWVTWRMFVHLNVKKMSYSKKCDHTRILSNRWLHPPESLDRDTKLMIKRSIGLIWQTPPFNKGNKIIFIYASLLVRSLSWNIFRCRWSLLHLKSWTH